MPTSIYVPTDVGMMPIRLTAEEIAALARMRALPTPPYVADHSDELCESGIRSLIARDLLRATESGNLTLPGMIQGLIAAVSVCKRFLVLTRNDGRSFARVGRVLLGQSGSPILEEEIYPHVYGFTPIDTELSGFVRRAFGIAEDSTASSDSIAADPTQVPIEHGQPTWPESWLAPQLNSLALFDGEGHQGSLLAWVTEGENIWLLEPDESLEVTTGTGSITASVLSLAVLTARLNDAVDMIARIETKAR